MPVRMFKAQDGKTYPIYSGKSESTAIRKFLVSHPSNYGLTARQMQAMMAGKTVKNRKDTGCCTLRPVPPPPAASVQRPAPLNHLPGTAHPLLGGILTFGGVMFGLLAVFAWRRKSTAYHGKRVHGQRAA